MSAVLTLCGGLLAILATLSALTLFTYFMRRYVEAAVPPLGRFLQVGATRLHIVDRGAGPPLVLVHGLGAQLRNFTYALVDRLEPHFRVICIDRPGCGYSTRPAHVSASLFGQAETIAELIESLGLDKPIIVGHSLGGAVALALVLNHPAVVGGVALIAPLTRVQNTIPEVFRNLVIHSKLLRTVIAWTLAVPMSLATGTKVLASVFRPDAVPADFSTAAGGLLAARPGQFLAACADLSSVNDDLAAMEQRYASIRVPVGILFGRHDEILSHEQHGIAMQSRINGLSLTLVDGGHMLPLTAPQQTAQWLSEFAGIRVTKTERES